MNFFGFTQGGNRLSYDDPTFCGKMCVLSTDELRRLKQLEGENTRLTKLVVDRDLEIEVIKVIAAKRR